MVKKSEVYSLAVTAMMAAVTAAVAPFAVPIGPIPMTLCTLSLYLSAYVLEWKRAAIATSIYLLLGVVGMPVFNGFQGGLGVVAGPTGGYIVGYIPLTVLSALVVKLVPRGRALHFLGMSFATAVLYALGTAWYCLQSGTALDVALQTCVLIFIPGDLLKIALAVTFGPILRDRLVKAGIPSDR